MATTIHRQSYVDWLETMGKAPPSQDKPADIIGTAVFVHDTLDLAAVIAHSIFGEAATHEDVFATYQALVARLPPAPTKRPSRG